MITQLQLDAYVGKRMADICANGFAGDAERQSAHFVGHALHLNVPPTCQTAGASRPGASVAASAIFARCRAVGAWSLRPSSVTACLVFSTPLNVVHLPSRALRETPRQQVGVFLNGFVWYYSPAAGVIARETAATFAQRLPAGFAMFYGTLP